MERKIAQQFEKDLAWMDKGEEKRHRDVKSGGPAGEWGEEYKEEQDRLHRRDSNHTREPQADGSEDSLINAIDSKAARGVGQVERPGSGNAHPEESILGDGYYEQAEEDARSVDQNIRAGNYEEQQIAKKSKLTIHGSGRLQPSARQLEERYISQSNRLIKRTKKRTDSNDRINLNAQRRKYQHSDQENASL